MKHIIKFYFYLTLVLLVGIWSGCQDPTTTKNSVAFKPKAKVPIAQLDSLYAFVQKQVDFGTRVPGSLPHTQCKNWLEAKLTSYADVVIVQEFPAQFVEGNTVQAYNIIAQFNPKVEERVVIAAHWDTRYVAEKDSDPSLQTKPILGADDGGSGTAGVLEIARLLDLNHIDLGVDLILFDAEDQGQSNVEGSYCLGSQYWASNPHEKPYKADFGILLDMIGSKTAQFPKEGYSYTHAQDLVNEVWTLAHRMGHKSLFSNTVANGIVDDHIYMMQLGFPVIDIINLDTKNNAFGHYHHTHKDDMDIISKSTMAKVTQVVLASLFHESSGSLNK